MIILETMAYNGCNYDNFLLIVTSVSSFSMCSIFFIFLLSFPLNLFCIFLFSLSFIFFSLVKEKYFTMIAIQQPVLDHQFSGSLSQCFIILFLSCNSGRKGQVSEKKMSHILSLFRFSPSLSLFRFSYFKLASQSYTQVNGHATTSGSIFMHTHLILIPFSLSSFLSLSLLSMYSHFSSLSFSLPFESAEGGSEKKMRGKKIQRSLVHVML